MDSFRRRNVKFLNSRSAVPAIHLLLGPPFMQVNWLPRWLLAVLYELQPLRYRDLKMHLRRIASDVILFSAAVAEALHGVASVSLSLVRSCSLWTWAAGVLWCGGWLLFHRLDFAKVYLILSLFAAIFASLRHKERGEVSAYSVFNAGFRRLLGTLAAEDFEAEILHRQHRPNGLGAVRVDQGVDAHQREPAAFQRRLRGKKARRTYEARLERRRLQAELEEEAFLAE